MVLNYLEATATEGPDRWMTRRDAAAFLRECGFPVAEATLATKVSRGGGPLYRLFSGRALYRPDDLLAWARSGLTTPRRSTAEADAQRTMASAA